MSKYILINEHRLRISSKYSPSNSFTAEEKALTEKAPSFLTRSASFLHAVEYFDVLCGQSFQLSWIPVVSHRQFL